MFVNILNSIEKDRYKLELVLINGSGSFYDLLPTHVKVYDLKCKAAKYALLKLVGVIKKSKPDLVLSTLTYINEITALALLFIKDAPPQIMRSAILESANEKTEGFIARKLLSPSYRKAAHIIALTKVMRGDLIENYHLNACKITVIPNMVDVEYVQKKSSEPVNEKFFGKKDNVPVITTMGRLSEQKGFEYLLQALKKVNNRYRAKLAVFGEGKLRSKLEGMVKTLNLENDVWFAGLKENPYKYIAKSDIFVLSSLWEGFPNALIEAMACGTAVISTNCSSGPSEIITPGLDGLLVPVKDVEEMAGAMARLVNNRALRVSITENAAETVKKYSPENIISRYKQVFNNIGKSGK